MPDATGTIVDGNTINGITDADSDSKSANTIAGGISEPEIINGFDVEQPSTEKFGSGDSGGNTDGIRLTKSGKPDKRATRWQRGKSAGTGTEETKIRLDTFSVNDLLLGIHAMAAEILKTPELELSKGESDKLGNAIQDVAKCYNHTINPKVAAWIQLCVVSGGIYGVRIAAIRIREKSEKKSKTKIVNGAPSPVFEMPLPTERDGGIN